MSDVVKILEHTKTLLVRKGWDPYIQDQRNRAGRIRLVRAIMLAATGLLLGDLTEKVFAHLVRTIGTDELVGEWEEVPSRTQEDVLALLDKAINTPENVEVTDE